MKSLSDSELPEEDRPFFVAENSLSVIDSGKFELKNVYRRQYGNRAEIRI